MSGNQKLPGITTEEAFQPSVAMWLSKQICFYFQYSCPHRLCNSLCFTHSLISTQKTATWRVFLYFKSSIWLSQLQWLCIVLWALPTLGDLHSILCLKASWSCRCCRHAAFPMRSLQAECKTQQQIVSCDVRKCDESIKVHSWSLKQLFKVQLLTFSNAFNHISVTESSIKN